MKVDLKRFVIGLDIVDKCDLMGVEILVGEFFFFVGMRYIFFGRGEVEGLLRGDGRECILRKKLLWVKV